MVFYWREYLLQIFISKGVVGWLDKNRCLSLLWNSWSRFQLIERVGCSLITDVYWWSWINQLTYFCIVDFYCMVLAWVTNFKNMSSYSYVCACLSFMLLTRCTWFWQFFGSLQFCHMNYFSVSALSSPCSDKISTQPKLFLSELQSYCPDNYHRQGHHIN